jgi:hypothetical protein
LDPVFVGAADVARCDVRRARENLVVTQNEYRLDLERYGGELNLDEANDILAADEKRIREFLQVQNLPGERGFTAREMILESRWDHHDPNTKRLYPRQVIHETPVTNYLEFGQAAQLLYGEKLPTVRLWTHWKQYVVGGVPDGVTEDYVYEFRATTRTGKGPEIVEGQAINQARLYAFAFQRPRIKVQIAQFQFRSRNPFPVKAGDLPEPSITTTTKRSTDQEALSILSEFDAAFQAKGY